MTLDRDDLIKAAAAVPARAARQDVKELSDAQLEAEARRSPLWATVPNPPGPGEPISDAHLTVLLRNCQIAEALGIES